MLKYDWIFWKPSNIFIQICNQDLVRTHGKSLFNYTEYYYDMNCSTDRDHLYFEGNTDYFVFKMVLIGNASFTTIICLLFSTESFFIIIFENLSEITNLEHMYILKTNLRIKILIKIH